jgi:lipopolysaccharide/colanic/teichoic acid biosynthesis glycosyltransferase
MQSEPLKRAIDVIGASIGLVVGAVPLGVAALAIRHTMGPPVVFRQVRPGRHARLFTIYKLRTMALGDGDDAERITPLGQFLRTTSIDELPELWNVLKGDMSLVGPRPLLVSYLDRYSNEQARRHDVRPGLTGLAQVSGRNLTTWDERLALDVAYVDTWSVGGDLRIMARTLLTVLGGRGVHADDHATMPELPVRSA